MSSQLPFTTISTVLESICRVELNHHQLQWSQLLCEEVGSHVLHSLLLLWGKISKLGLWTLASFSFSDISFKELTSWWRNGGISLRSSGLLSSCTEHCLTRWVRGDKGLSILSVLCSRQNFYSISISCMENETHYFSTALTWDSLSHR